jgi:hypothetical protein
MRRSKQGSVCLDTRSKKWCFYSWENGQRRSKTIGSVSQFPTKASAWRAVSETEARWTNGAVFVRSVPAGKNAPPGEHTAGL